MSLSLLQTLKSGPKGRAGIGDKEQISVFLAF